MNHENMQYENKTDYISNWRNIIGYKGKKVLKMLTMKYLLDASVFRV